MLRRLLHAGTHYAGSVADAQRVQIVNAVILAALAITLGLQPANLVVGDWSTTYNGFAAAGLFLAAYWLNATGRAWGAALILSLVTPVAIVAQLCFEDAIKGGSQLFLLPAALIPFLAFPSASTRAATLVSLVSTLVLIVDVLTRHNQADVLAALAEPGPRTEIVHAAVGLLTCLLGYFTWRLLRVSEAGVAREQRHSEALLLDLFPGSIARRLQRRERISPERHGDASVLFCRVVESAAAAPDLQLRVLSGLYAALDDVCARHGVEKIKTFVHSSMAACGVPQARPDHAEVLVSAALEMLAVAGRSSSPVVIRIGVHSGPVVAGVIGRNRYTYDLWGDVVNTAQRMEAHGLAGAVQISAVTFSKVNHRFRCEPRDPIQIKGKLVERTWLVRGASEEHA